MTEDNTKKVESLFHKIKKAFKKADKKQQNEIVDNLTEIKENAESLNQQRLILEAEIKLENTKKEIEAIKHGYGKYVLKDDVNQLIEALKTKDGGRQLAFSNLESYPRVIPQKNAELIKQAKKYFDTIYILYTAKKEEVEKEKLAKDPIAFGVVKHTSDDQNMQRLSINTVESDHMFFITDWVDEYCDLTLDMLVQLSKEELQKNDIIKGIEDLNEEMKG